MNIKPEDVAWFVRWATVVKKVRDGASSTESTTFTPMECNDLIRGLHGLSQTVKEEEHGLE